MTDKTTPQGHAAAFHRLDDEELDVPRPVKRTPLEQAVDMAERGFSLQPEEAQVLLTAYREALTSAAAWKELSDSRDAMNDANVRHVRINCGIMFGDSVAVWTEYQAACARHEAARKAVGK